MQMMKKLILFLMIIGLQGFCFAQSDEEKCPVPTTDDFGMICSEIYYRGEAKVENTILNYSYQEWLWKISCADIMKDDFETAKTKI